MLEAVDAIVAAGFDIRPFAVKSRLLKRLVEQAASGSDFQVSAVSMSCEVCRRGRGQRRD